LIENNKNEKKEREKQEEEELGIIVYLLLIEVIPSLEKSSSDQLEIHCI
jgi:hypothetical protein